jgi:hypothetical protein
MDRGQLVLGLRITQLVTPDMARKEITHDFIKLSDLPSLIFISTTIFFFVFILIFFMVFI